MLNIFLSPAQRHLSLTVFPLTTPEPQRLPYTLLGDAIAAGALEITEVGSGSVPELSAINGSDAAVLVLDGEQLIGARQNRMTNRSILLPPNSKTTIPVSCMEQGRWHRSSDHFDAAPQHSPATARREARDIEASHVRAGRAAAPGVLAEAQHAVWLNVADCGDRVDATSATGALNDLFAAKAPDIDSWLAEFPPLEQQVGLVAFLGDRPLGMDVLGCPTLYARLHDRLLRGYVMDALGTKQSADISQRRAQEFLDQVREAERVPAPTVGIGEYAVLTGAAVGGELRHAERTAHLSAFPPREQREEGPRGPRGSYNSAPILPPSRRRR